MNGTGSCTLIGVGLMVGAVAERMDEAVVTGIADAGSGTVAACSGETGLSGLSEPGMTTGTIGSGAATCGTTSEGTTGAGAAGGIGVGIVLVFGPVLGRLAGSGELVKGTSVKVRRSAVTVAGGSSSCSSCDGLVALGEGTMKSSEGSMGKLSLSV